MRTTTILAALLTLGACATPDELMQSGERSDHVLANPPALAIACMTRNLERTRGHAIPVIRALDGGGTELVIQTMLVAHARPHAHGSAVRVWLRPEWFYGRAELVPALVAGC